MLRIIHRKDGMYDVYDKTSDKWLFSYLSADNVFSQLAKYGQSVQIKFVDEFIQNINYEVIIWS